MQKEGKIFCRFFKIENQIDNKCGGNSIFFLGIIANK